MSVTLVETQKRREHVQLLYDGRLDWAAVEKVFDARLVEIVGSGSPGVYPSGEKQGLTRQRFSPGDTIAVRVEQAGMYLLFLSD